MHRWGYLSKAITSTPTAGQGSSMYGQLSLKQPGHCFLLMIPFLSFVVVQGDSVFNSTNRPS